MAKIKIDKKLLAELRTYFLDGGSVAIEDVAEKLNTDDHDVVDAYTQALRDTYPEDFPSNTEEAEDDDTEPDFFLIGENNILTPLAMVTNKKGKVVFKIKEPEEKVSVLVRGTVREIDLYQLRKNPSGETHGVSNAVLISLGEIAKG